MKIISKRDLKTYLVGFLVGFLISITIGAVFALILDIEWGIRVTGIFVILVILYNKVIMSHTEVLICTAIIFVILLRWGFWLALILSLVVLIAKIIFECFIRIVKAEDYGWDDTEQKGGR
jgi:hypothetical protein